MDEGDISQTQYDDKFFDACLQFHKGAFLNEIVDVHFLCVRLQKYVSFSKTPINELEEEITYRIDVLSWYYLYQMKIPGTTKSKFENLFRLAKIVLCIVHSNAEEESLFSRVKKTGHLREHPFH